MRGRGVPTRRGGPWTYTSVRAILANSIYTGKLTYNRRRFRLNKKTGNRVPVFRESDEHLVRQDESLRIISDVDFEAVRRLLAKRSRPETRGSRQRSKRPFTGLIFCEQCNSVCYGRSSKNSRGFYRYIVCGRRQRLGPECCDNTTSIREDSLVAGVTQTFMEMFDDTDQIIAEALPKAQEMLAANREDSQALRRQMLRLEAKIGSLMRFAEDPDLNDNVDAKRAIIRQIGEVESQRETLGKRLGQIPKQSSQSTVGLMKAIRQALGEARESLLNVAEPGQMRRFLEQFVGPMILRADGTVAQKIHPEEVLTSSGCRSTSNIAGVGFEPTTSGL